MKKILHAEIDSLEFQLWDAKTETIIEQADMESFIEENPDRAAKVIVDSLRMFVEDLRERLGQDLTDCYNRGSEQ